MVDAGVGGVAYAVVDAFGVEVEAGRVAEEFLIAGDAIAAEIPKSKDGGDSEEVGEAASEFEVGRGGDEAGPNAQREMISEEHAGDGDA